MTEDSRVFAVTAIGAIVGGLVAYLFYTEQGRKVRRAMEPALDDLASELSSFQTTARKAVHVATEGWKLLSEALEDRSPPAAPYISSRQSSPF